MGLGHCQTLFQRSPGEVLLWIPPDGKEGSICCCFLSLILGVYKCFLEDSKLQILKLVKNGFLLCKFSKLWILCYHKTKMLFFFLMKTDRHRNIWGFICRFYVSHFHLNWSFLPSIVISIDQLFSISIRFLSRKFLNRTIEFLKLEGTHKGHKVQLPAPHRNTYSYIRWLRMSFGYIVWLKICLWGLLGIFWSFGLVINEDLSLVTNRQWLTRIETEVREFSPRNSSKYEVMDADLAAARPNKGFECLTKEIY